VEQWGIPFEPIGFHATFFMLQISNRPANCPGGGGESRRDNDFDAVIQEWAWAKLANFDQLLKESRMKHTELS